MSKWRIWRDTNRRGHVHLANFETREDHRCDRLSILNGKSNRTQWKNFLRERGTLVVGLARSVRCLRGSAVKASAPRPSILCSLSRSNLGNVKKEERGRGRISGVEGVLAREDRMRDHEKFRENLECLGSLAGEWENLAWHSSDWRKMFRGTVSRETWTLALFLLLFAHVACLDVKLLRNNSLTTSNYYGVSSSHWTVKLASPRYEWCLNEWCYMQCNNCNLILEKLLWSRNSFLFGGGGGSGNFWLRS